MQPPPARQIHEFGDFELDTLRRVLVSRLDGKPVDITGRVLDALVHLVERPGQLVEKKALIEALWPHVVVEEGNLSQTIHSLRRVLGERAGEHRYIATVPGRGYRFVAEVRTRAVQAPASASSPAPASAPEPTPAPPAPSAPAWGEPAATRRSKSVPVFVATAVVLLAIVAALVWRQRVPDEPAARTQPSIAVLPFVDMSEAQDQEHFADGLSEEILNLLAQADGLRVIARTSSFSFRDRNVDIGMIAQRLSVSHVLEGSVRKAGDRVRITAQLIDASTSAHLWSDTFDRDVKDIFGVQREIATAVADALHVTLRHAAPRRAETSSPDAYEHYLQGRHLFHRRSGTDLLQARVHFEKAVGIDPDYGRAWAGLAGFHMVARYDALEVPLDMDDWREAVERAVTLAPDLAEAHARAAQYYWHIDNAKVAYAHFKRAEALDPEEPLVLGMNLTDAIHDGRMDQAVATQRRVVARDPLSAVNRGNLGSALFAAGELKEALAEYQRALELSPASPIVITNIADVLMLQGRTDEATDVIRRIPEGFDRDARLAIAYIARGEVREADEMVARLQTLAAQENADQGMCITVAGVHAFNRDPDRAFDWLHAALMRSGTGPRSNQGWALIEELSMAPFLMPLHADPRWDELLQTLRKQTGD